MEEERRLPAHVARAVRATHVRLLRRRVLLVAEVRATDGEDELVALRGQRRKGSRQDSDGAIEVPVIAECFAEHHHLVGRQSANQLRPIERAADAIGGIIHRSRPEQRDSSLQRGNSVAADEHLHNVRFEVSPATG